MKRVSSATPINNEARAGAPSRLQSPVGLEIVDAPSLSMFRRSITLLAAIAPARAPRADSSNALSRRAFAGTAP